MAIDNGAWDVAVPVTVYIEGGKVVGAEVDYDNAPWPMVTAGGNVYDPLTEEYVTQDDVAAVADAWVTEVLADLGLPGVSE